jgi:predicted nucleic acid-binding protein
MLVFYQEMFDVVSLVDDDTAAEYGYLRASTASVGQPIADNDLWIAACATANGLPWPLSIGVTSNRSRSSA